MLEHSSKKLRDAKAIAERVIAGGEIYKGEELLAEQFLALLVHSEGLQAKVSELEEEIRTLNEYDQ